MKVRECFTSVTAILATGLLCIGCNRTDIQVDMASISSEICIEDDSNQSEQEAENDSIVDLGYVGDYKLANEVEEAYQLTISFELDNPPYEDYKTDINYGMGDIDGDAVPELLMIRGDSHIDTVTIYTYDVKSKSVVYVGDFGGYGMCECVFGENKIISSYGNGGYYFTCVTEIGTDKQPVLVDVILNDGSQEEVKNYYGFKLVDFNGAMPRGDYDINRFESIDEGYLISQEEADSIIKRMYEHSTCIDMKYCDNVAVHE